MMMRINRFNASRLRRLASIVLLLLGTGLSSCGKDDNPSPDGPDTPDNETSDFYFGSDLSYANQILDHNGTYTDNGQPQSPYKILKDHGANLTRFWLWHHPAWTKDVYGADGTQFYSDLADVEKGIRLAKAQGMDVLLDFHYSDTWTDPGQQDVPAAWQTIKDLNVLADSVYNYTLKTLQHLDAQGLMPELVQLGNETNCGMLYSAAPAGFPTANACNGQWQQLGRVLNSGIQAVRKATAASSVKTKIVLHVADPKNVDWWFSNITTTGKVSDFDIIGFSYYPLWQTTVPLSNLSTQIAGFKRTYGKEVMLLETAYPWTTKWNDDYGNSFGSEPPIAGFPFTQQGQYDFLVTLAQEVKDGGGMGLIYWEPAWITSQLKTQWGTGSSWENATLFDFSGAPVKGMDYMKYDYK